MWGLGAAVCLGRCVRGYLRFSRAVRRTAEPPCPAARALLRRLDPAGRAALAESPHVPAPMLLGVLRPLIVLPAGVDDPARLEDILRHELVHARRHDLLYKWLTAAVTSLHWFNPLMYLVRREVARRCELSCDEAVLRTLDQRGRRRYGETLLALATPPPPGMGVLAVTLCEEKAHLRERLVSIAGYRKGGPRRRRPGGDPGPGGGGLRPGGRRRDRSAGDRSAPGDAAGGRLRPAGGRNWV